MRLRALLGLSASCLLAACAHQGDGGGINALARIVAKPLFHILPLSTQLDMAEATPSRLATEIGWDDEAKAALDALVEREPVLVRISAAKRLRDAAERAARAAGDDTVSTQILEQALQQARAA